MTGQSPAPDSDPVTAIEMVEIARLSSPQLSPDGSKVAYLKSEVNWDANRRIRRLHIMDTATGAELPGPEPETDTESFRAGVWAPGSRQLLIPLKRNGDKHRQAYLFDTRSAVLTKLTDHPASVQSPSFHPDGSGFFFLAEKAKDLTTQHHESKRWAIAAYDEKPLKQLWFHNQHTGHSRLLVGGDFHVRSYSLARDGKSLVFAKTPGPLSDERHNGEIWRFDLESGQQQVITNNDFYESKASLAPDGKTIAFIATVDRNGKPYYEDNLFVQSIDDNKARLLLPDLAMEVLDYAWGNTPDHLFVVGNTGLRTHLYRLDLHRESLTPLTEGNGVWKSWHYQADVDLHTGIWESARNPGEIHWRKSKTGPLKPLTQHYERWNQHKRLPRQEAFQWRGRGRQTVEGLLVYPVDYQSGDGAFPLVTITHGGPRTSAQFGSWNVSRYVSVLAGQGYGVLLPNHRGSNGYGDAFMRDMLKGYFHYSHTDVLDGIDALVQQGLADPNALVAMGWSAGGHMTNKLITYTHRFKAASSGAGASHWLSMHGESDVRYMRAFVFGPEPWLRTTSRRSHDRHSPLKDAWKVTTPTLFFAGENDVRVPPTQSILMHRGVKQAGTPTHFYLAPDEPHNYAKPSHQLFKIQTELAWYAKHLGREAYATRLPTQARLDVDPAVNR